MAEKYQEVYEAIIDIKLPSSQARAVEEGLRSLEALAERVTDAIHEAFASASGVSANVPEFDLRYASQESVDQIKKMVDAIQVEMVRLEEVAQKGGEGFFAKITGLFRDTSKESVDESIVPDMVDAILRELNRMVVGSDKIVNNWRKKMLDGLKEVEEYSRDVEILEARRRRVAPGSKAEASVDAALQHSRQVLAEKEAELDDAAGRIAASFEKKFGEPITMTTREVADALGTTTRNVRKLIAATASKPELAGPLEAFKGDTGRWKVVKSSVDEYTQSLTQAAKEQGRFMDVMDVGERIGMSFQEVMSLVADGTLKVASGSKITTASIEKYEATLTGATTKMDSIREVADRLGKTFGETTELISRGTLKFGKNNQITVQSLEDYEQKIKEGLRASQNMERMMDSMDSRTQKLRDGFRILAGGEGLLGLKTMLVDTKDETGKTARAFGMAEKFVGLFSQGASAGEKALLRHMKGLQEDSFALRNWVNEFKDASKQEGIAKARVEQLTESMRVHMNMVRQSTNTAIRKKEIDDTGIAAMKNTIEGMRTQIKLFKENNAEQLENNESLQRYLKTLESELARRERVVEILEAYNDQVKKEHREHKEAEKAKKKDAESTSLLAKFLSLLNRNTKDSARSTRSLSESAKGATMSFAKLTGAFVAARAIGDVLRNKFYDLSNSVKTFTHEFMGLGVIDDFMRQLTTGPVELAAHLQQLETTLGAVGQQAGYSLDFLNAKVAELKDNGATSQAAYEAMLKGISKGLPVGTLNEDAEAVLEIATSAEAAREKLAEFGVEVEDGNEQLAALALMAENGEVGMETLLKTAQNLASAMGGDSSKNLQDFITSISRGSTELLEANGIATNASEMFEKYAQTMNDVNDTTENTARNLDDTQRAMAIFTGLIQEGTPYAAAYDAAMGSIGKQMGSMKRHIENAKEALGNLFLPVLTIFVEKFGEFIKALQIAAESPAAEQISQAFIKLASVMNPVNAVLRFLVNHFDELASVMASFVNVVSSLFSGDLGGALEHLKEGFVSAIAFVALYMGDAIQNAFNWGRNLIVNLANGLMDAAQTVLRAAAEAIGNIVGLFFAPGSPPERGPLSQIDKWGAGLMSTLANGMASAASGELSTTADAIGEMMTKSFRNLDLSSFRAIKDALGPIRQIFQGMVGSGQMDEAELIPNLVQVRELMAQLYNTFEDTGEISDEVLDNIGDLLGEAGEDMQEYIRLQLELQKAKEEIESIDQEIAAAEQAGFVPAELRKKKEEAMKRASEIQEQIALQRELLAWQQEGNDLVQRQIDLLERIASANEKAAGAAGQSQQDQWQAFQKRYKEEMAALERKRDLGLITEEEFQKGRLSLEQRYIDTAIKLNQPLSEERINAFKQLREQMKALSGGGAGGLETLADSAGRSKQDLIEMANASALGLEGTEEKTAKINEEFAKMKGRVRGVFDEIGNFLTTPLHERLQGILDWFRDLLPDAVKDAASGMSDALGGVGGALGGVSPGGAAAGLALAPAAVSMAPAALGKMGGGLTKLLAPLKKLLQPLLTLLSKLASVILGPLLGALKGLGGAIVGVLGPVGATIAAIAALVAIFVLFRDEIEGIGGAIMGFLTPLIEVVQAVVERLYGLSKVVIENVTTAISNFVGRIAEMEVVQRWMVRLRKVAEVLVVILGALVGIIGTVLAGAVEALSAVIDPLLQVLAGLFEALLLVAEIALETFLMPFQFLIKVIKGDDPLGFLEDKLMGLLDSLKGLGQALLGIIVSLAETIWDFLVGLVDGAFGMITGKFGAVKDAAKEVEDWVKDKARGVTDWLGDVTGLAGEAEDSTTSFAESIREEFGYSLGAVKRAAKEAGMEVDDYIAALRSGKIPTSDLEEHTMGLSEKLIKIALSGVAAAEEHRELARSAEMADRAMLNSVHAYQAARDEADSLVVSMGNAAGRMGEMYGEAKEAADTYHDERARIWRERDAEVQKAIEEGRTDEVETIKSAYAEEIAALDEKYKEEARLRKEAMAQEMLDLNQQIMQRRLAQAGSAEEAAEIVESHRKKAEEIVDYYGVDIDAAAGFVQAAGGSIRELGLQMDGLLEKAGVTFPQFLGLMEKVETDGYDSLTTKQQQAFNEIVVGMAQQRADMGAEADEIATILGALPIEYQGSVMKMVEENKPLEDMLAAMEALPRVVDIEVNVDVKRGRDAREPMQLMSPKTQMQKALENLVAYADDNPVNVQVEFPAESAESMNVLIAGLESVGGEGSALERILSTVSMNIKSSFRSLQLATVGPGGHVTQMIRRIEGLFRGLSSVYGVLSQFKDRVVSIFTEAGKLAAQGLIQSFKGIGSRLSGELSGEGGLTEVIRNFFEAEDVGLLDTMYDYGYDMMNELANGIAAGLSRVQAMLDRVEDMVGNVDFNPNDDQSVTFSPDISSVGAPSTVSSTVRFERGAFEGAFPGVKDARDAEYIMRVLNDRIDTAKNFRRVGA